MTLKVFRAGNYHFGIVGVAVFLRWLHCYVLAVLAACILSIASVQAQDALGERRIETIS